MSRSFQRITWIVGHDRDDVANERALVMFVVFGIAGTTRFRP
jgi:hypothetical protein